MHTANPVDQATKFVFFYVEHATLMNTNSLDDLAIFEHSARKALSQTFSFFIKQLLSKLSL